ncbi:MAG: hypothetical protein QN144_12180 [Armatimonadota bacterium]|nr:hypothetical protein [Armatimonadota bacterium]
MARIRHYTAGRLTNPGANTVLADTGPIPEDDQLFDVYATVRSSVGALIRCELRDDTNTNTLELTELNVPAGNTVHIKMPFYIRKGQRIRLVLDAAITGNITASLRLFLALPWMA